MDIPFSIEPRADTGVVNATLGTWLFIASEVMLFGSLFSTYAFLRAGAPVWPNQGAILNVGLASINSVVLLASSVAMISATRLLNDGRAERSRQALTATVLLGLLFLGLKGLEYAGEIGDSFRPGTNNFIGLYFVLTGLHAVHAIGGVVVNAWLAGTTANWHSSGRAQLRARLKAASLYWNFVDIMWLAIFVMLYLA